MQSKEQIFKLLNLHFAMIPGVHILSLHTPLHRTHSSSTRCAPTHVTVPPERVSHVVYNPIMPTNRHIIVPTAHLLRARNHPIFRAPTLVAVHSECVSSVVNNFIVSADRYSVTTTTGPLSAHHLPFLSTSTFVAFVFEHVSCTVCFSVVLTRFCPFSCGVH